jgi:hypothetical protein
MAGRNAWLVGLCLAGVGAPTMTWGEDMAAKGLEIAKKAGLEQQGFGTERATLNLELINAHGDVTARKMSMEVQEGIEDGDKSRSMFEWPADVKGTKLLTWTHKKSDDDQWLYLPAVKRIKRISSNNRSGSFMGSEFAYEDLSSQEVEKYTYRFVDEAKQGDRPVWRIERHPVDKTSGYKRQIVWMDKEYQSPLRIEYFDRKDELLKVANFVGYKKIGKYWKFQSIQMSNVQTKKKSNLTWEGRQLGVRIPPETFDSARLED